MYQKNEAVPVAVPRESHLCNLKDFEKRQKRQIENPEFVENKILNYWDSVGAFHAKANGYCLIVDNMAVSLALTGWIADNVHTILKHGKAIAAKLAQNLGFSKSYDYICFAFDLTN